MTTTQIIIRQIIPNEGKVLTDGEVYSDCVYLGAEDTVARWEEVDPPAWWGEEQSQSAE